MKTNEEILKLAEQNMDVTTQIVCAGAPTHTLIDDLANRLLSDNAMPSRANNYMLLSILEKLHKRTAALEAEPRVTRGWAAILGGTSGFTLSLALIWLGMHS